ncbi:cytosol aminopeptidase-like [Paramacrobiotus metropolitanus]|uniref:cytosol aminopeptidase-like n=1 Tax=Paramacrobiotus metropolitanus TaxID=2943436 RepID=UPI002445C2B0|nr:cytosol aminopeptidase-like [Paramacrobiotus metropolitanus]
MIILRTGRFAIRQQKLLTDLVSPRQPKPWLQPLHLESSFFITSIRLFSRTTVNFVSYKTQKMTTHRGLVLGVYDPIKEDVSKCGEADIVGTPAFQDFNTKFKGALGKTLINTGYFNGKMKRGKVRIFHGVDDAYTTIVVVGLGSKQAGVNELEQWDEGRENVRVAAAAAIRQLQEISCTEAELDTFGDDEAAAEGSFLQMYSFDELKHPDKRKQAISLRPLEKSRNGEWDSGVLLAEGQNYVRTLMETPSNLKLPPVLAERIAKDLSSVPNLTVTIRDEQWAEQKGMGALLSVSHGSSVPARLLEISYKGCGGDDYHAIVVGKGITFDTGGISLKPAANMDLMRGDMGGAACTAGALLTVAKLKLPINLLGLLPIAENMPGSTATRPGDVVRAMNGKTIQIDNTDAEGRLILADALCYAQEFKSKFIVDLATLTGAIRIALGGAAAGVFTNNTKAWQLMLQSSIRTGDRVWRMPLFKTYADKMTDCHLADINNIGGAGLGGSCTAAGFLSEFIKKDTKWMHMDIAGVSENKEEVPYLRKGFTGRPLRTLVQFVQQLEKETL